MVASRATWIGVLVATIVVLVFKREGRLAWLRNQAAIAGAGAAIFLASSSIVAKAPETTPVPGVKSIVERGEGSMLERVALARSALAFVREHPFFGVGPGQFGLQQYSMPAAHPHNTPLQLASEYGIPAGAAGIALILTLVVFAVRSLRVEIPGNNDLVGASLAAALMAGITDSLFSGNLIMPHSQVLLCVVAGWLVGRSRLTSPAPITSPSRLQITRTTLVATALLAATVTTILALEYLPLARDIPAWSMRRNPHFWQYGRFDAW
jgi:O-antigen ligase